MPYIEVSSFKKQEDNEKIKVKKEAKNLNQKVKTDMESKKKLNVFKDIKYEKAPTEKTQMNDFKKEIELQRFFEEQKKMIVSDTISSEEGKMFEKHINHVLALPEQNLYKRELFSMRLKQNKVIQEYVQENIVYNCVSRVNKNIKFLLHYGLEYHEANEEYKKLLLIAQQQQQQKQIIPEQKVEESKVEDIEEEIQTEINAPQTEIK